MTIGFESLLSTVKGLAVEQFVCGCQPMVDPLSLASKIRTSQPYLPSLPLPEYSSAKDCHCVMCKLQRPVAYGAVAPDADGDTGDATVAALVGFELMVV